MTELQHKVEESNKAIQRVEESLSARLAVLEREFRYTSTKNDNGGALPAKMTRATEGQVDPHLEELKKLEQLAKVYGKGRSSTVQLPKRILEHLSFSTLN